MHSEDDDTKYLICSKPFNWYEVAWNKEAYLCCQGWLNKSAGNAMVQHAKEIWNSADAKKIRTSVIDGSFRYCNAEHCPHLINKTFPVQYVDKQAYNTLKNRIENIGTEENRPGWLNFSYDQSCNLSCPSCRKEIVIASKNEREQYADLAHETLAAFGENIKELYITGSGDPFASRHFWELLTSNELLKYPQLSMRIHTNGQLCTPKRWDMIRHIEEKISTLEISIDAASAETYALNRTPGHWNVLCENMDFVSALRKANRIKRLQLDFVVQDNNFHEMKKFVEYAKAWNADTVYFSALNNWGTFSAQEYLRRAVHRPNHKNHTNLVEVLKDPAIWNPIVYCGFVVMALAPAENTREVSRNQIEATEI
jgi:hypothetical protein